MKGGSFLVVSCVTVPQQHQYPFALIYFAHKTKLETIAFSVPFGSFMLHSNK